MRSGLIRMIVLIVASILVLAFVVPWLRGSDPPPALMGIVAVSLISTNILRSFRVPLWRLRRLGWPRRSRPSRRPRRPQQPLWWPRGVREPTWLQGGRAGAPSPFVVASTAMCAVVFASLFFWPSAPPTLAADTAPARLASTAPAAAPAPRTAAPPERGHATARLRTAEGIEPDTSASAGTFRCTVTGVHDGDGPIYCAEGPKIRPQAVAAREADETCRPHHACPAASGAAATAALRTLALGKVLRCEATGTSYRRVTAWCSTTQGVELNCAMVRGGTVAYWPRYDPDGRLCRS